MGGYAAVRGRPYPPSALTTKKTSMPKFFSRFSKKLKLRFAGDGPKPGGSGSGGSVSDATSVSADLGNKGDGDQGMVNSVGLPANLEATPGGGRIPELRQGRLDANTGVASSMVSSPRSGGEEVPGNGHRRERNEAIIEGEVDPVNPPSQSDLGISQGDRGPSGGT